MYKDITILFFTYLLVLNLTPIIGFIFLKNLNFSFPSKKHTYFVSLCIGLIVIVTFFSIFFTKGKTINILFIPLIFFTFFFKNNDSQIKNNFSFKDFINESSQLTLFGIAIFFISSFYFFINQKYFIKLPHGDLIFYSKISNYLLNFGTETKFLDYVYENNTLLPYHYFELWLNSAFTYFTNKQSLYSLIFVTYPLLSSIVVYGFHSLISHKNKILNYFIPIVLIFWTGVCPINQIDNDFLNQLPVFCRNLYIYPKLYAAYFFVIGSLISLKNNNIKLALFFSVFASISSITLMLPLLISITLIYLVLLKKKNKIAKQFVPFLIIFACIIFFYLAFSNHNSGQLSSVKTTFNYFSNWYKTKIKINIVIKSTLQTVVIYFPIILILFINRNIVFNIITSNILKFKLAVLVITSSLLSWAIFNTVLDSIQFYNNLAITIINILSLLILTNIFYQKTLVSKKIITISIASIIFILNCIYSANILTKHRVEYNQLDIKTISQKINKNDKEIGVYIKSKEDYNANTIFDKFAELGQYTAVINKNFDFICLSVFDIPSDSLDIHFDLERKMIRNSSFYKHVKEEIDYKTFESINKSQFNFIKKNNIKFLITSQNVHISKEIRTLVQDSVTERISKEKFYVLKQK